MQENLAPSVAFPAASAGSAAPNTSDAQLRGVSPVRAPAEERQQPKAKGTAAKKKGNRPAMSAAERRATVIVPASGKADIKASVCILFRLHHGDLARLFCGRCWWCCLQCNCIACAEHAGHQPAGPRLTNCQRQACSNVLFAQCLQTLAVGAFACCLL